MEVQGLSTAQPRSSMRMSILRFSRMLLARGFLSWQGGCRIFLVLLVERGDLNRLRGGGRFRGFCLAEAGFEGGGFGGFWGCGGFSGG